MVLIHPFKHPHDQFIAFGSVREAAAGAHLDLPSVCLFIAFIARAVFHMVKRTVAEQAVKACRIRICAAVARKVSAFPVFKIFIRILHPAALPISAHRPKPAALHLKPGFRSAQFNLS